MYSFQTVVLVNLILWVNVLPEGCLMAKLALGQHEYGAPLSIDHANKVSCDLNIHDCREFLKNLCVYSTRCERESPPYHCLSHMVYSMMQGIYGWGKVWEKTESETREAVCKELVRDKEGREENWFIHIMV